MISNTLYCTIKKSIKRSIWQIKDAVSHEQVVLHGMARQLDAAVVELGGDPTDPMVIWDLVYSGDKLPRPTFRMELMESHPGRLIYRVALGPGATSGTEGWLPMRLFSPWGEAPTTLWARIEPTRGASSAFLSPYLEKP